MTRRQYIVLVIIAVLAGLVGGFTAGGFLYSRHSHLAGKFHDRVVAKEFRVVDENGKTMARFGWSKPSKEENELKRKYGQVENYEGGLASLSFYGPQTQDGWRSPTLTISPQELFMSSQKGDGFHGARFNAHSLSLYSESSDNKGAKIELSDRQLFIYDANFKPRVWLVLHEIGPQLVLADENGAPRAVIGKGYLNWPDTGKQVTLPESSIVLIDKQGKVVWQPRF